MLPKRTCLGELEIIEVFDFFDFPRLFSCHNKTGQIFFALSVEDDIDKAMFIYTPISLGRYRLLVSGSLSIRDAIRLAEDSFVFNVEFTSSGETAEMISCSEIPDVWLPEESEVIISSESAIPYQNVQSATDYAYSTLRETINFALKLPKNSTQVAARILGDPPYATSGDLYAHVDADVGLAVRDWCVTAPRELRVILCGYDTEHDALLAHGWTVTEGKSGSGAGYSTNSANGRRERLWLSPACIGTTQPSLLDAL